MLKEVCAQARKRSCNSIVQGRQDLSATLHVQQQGCSRAVEGWCGSAPTHTLNEMTLTEARGSVQNKNPKLVTALL